jgi:hypothetical protein
MEGITIIIYVRLIRIWLENLHESTVQYAFSRKRLRRCFENQIGLLNVSHFCQSPVMYPIWNHFARCALEPWVNDSGVA